MNIKANNYDIAGFSSNGKVSSHMRKWLFAGVLSLIVSGIYSIIIVIARTPKLSEIFKLKDIFHTSLVIHVDMSVLVWFLSFAAIIWSILPCYFSGNKSWIKLPYINNIAFYTFLSGVLLMAASPLTGGEPLMNNYVPVLTNGIFFSGLGLILGSVMILCFWVIFKTPPKLIFKITPNDELTINNVILFGIYSSAIITIISLLSFILSAKLIDNIILGEQYYEIIFWAGGHILQFTHTQLLILAWIWLLSAIGLQSHIKHIMLYILLWIGLVFSILSLAGFVLYDVSSQEYMDFYSNIMIIGGGIASAIVGLYILFSLIRRKFVDGGEMLQNNKALLSCLIMSILLFAVGGVFGLAINGVNVKIPAHYHGSIVGITLAFMGVIYLILPKLGLAEVSYMKLAIWQPIIYGFGQLMHISGLAYSGGYGVLRKTPGGMENLPWQAKAAMGFMGGGGLLAIIGGVIFIIVIYKSWRLRPVL